MVIFQQTNKNVDKKNLSTFILIYQANYIIDDIFKYKKVDRITFCITKNNLK